MDGRQTNRRMVLKGVLGAIGLLAVGRGAARAEKKTGGLAYDSKEDFKTSCDAGEINGIKGEFIDSPKDKLTLCVWGDGSKTTCDQNGKDCTWNPPPKSSAPGSHWDDVGGDLPLFAADPGITPVDARGQGGKRRKRGGRRKK